MKLASFFLISITLTVFSYSQSRVSLPSLNVFTNSIDTFYNNLTDAQIEEFNQSRKGRWLNYLPSPGYSPFAGGFTLSLNLSAPLQEAKLSREKKYKIESIRKSNALLRDALKNEIAADYKAVQNTIYEYHALDSLEALKHKAFALFTKQYERNELTPSEFLVKQMDMESFKVARTAALNAISRAILNLYIKAKGAVANDNYALKNLN